MPPFNIGLGRPQFPIQTPQQPMMGMQPAAAMGMQPAAAMGMQPGNPMMDPRRMAMVALGSSLLSNVTKPAEAFGGGLMNAVNVYQQMQQQAYDRQRQDARDAQQKQYYDLQNKIATSNEARAQKGWENTEEERAKKAEHANAARAALEAQGYSTPGMSDEAVLQSFMNIADDKVIPDWAKAMYGENAGPAMNAIRGGMPNEDVTAMFGNPAYKAFYAAEDKKEFDRKKAEWQAQADINRRSQESLMKSERDYQNSQGPAPIEINQWVDDLRSLRSNLTRDALTLYPNGDAESEEKILLHIEGGIQDYLRSLDKTAIPPQWQSEYDRVMGTDEDSVWANAQRIARLPGFGPDFAQRYAIESGFFTEDVDGSLVPMPPPPAEPKGDKAGAAKDKPKEVEERGWILRMIDSWANKAMDPNGPIRQSPQGSSGFRFEGDFGIDNPAGAVGDAFRAATAPGYSAGRAISAGNEALSEPLVDLSGVDFSPVTHFPGVDKFMRGGMGLPIDMSGVDVSPATHLGAGARALGRGLASAGSAPYVDEWSQRGEEAKAMAKAKEYMERGMAPSAAYQDALRAGMGESGAKAVFNEMIKMGGTG